MRNGFLLGVLAVGALAIPARAELPDDLLARDHQNCLQGDKDPKRAAYCDCIRDGMKSWTELEYVRVAMQTAMAAGKSEPPPKLQKLAQKCIAQVMP